MSDRLYRQLARLISDSFPSTEPSTNLENPSSSIGFEASSVQVLTPEMVRFTRENILKLPPERQQELAYITERTVASVDALPNWINNVLQPEELPVENQIMIWRYVKMHLQTDSANGMEVADGGRKMGDGETGVAKAGDGAAKPAGINDQGGLEGEDDMDIDIDLDGDIDPDMDVDYDLGIE